MSTVFRHFNLLCAVTAVCVGAAVFDAAAQAYPTKPIHIFVGYAAGGSTDITARLLAQKLSENVGQAVIVDNLAGASGALADEKVAKSPTDGYTLLLMAGSATIMPALRKLPYDVERDLMPISLVSIAPYVLVVHPSVPARNVDELIALARAQPGKLSYGSAGIGSTPHLAGELFKLMAKVNIVYVPFKGGAENVIATAGGHIEMSYPTTLVALPLVETGKLRPLAVTSAKRAALMPAIPTLDESGLPGYDRFSWFGLVAPAGVPKDVITRLHAAVEKEVNSSAKVRCE